MISTRGHKGEVKWVIAATQIKYSWGDRLYALIQIWDLILNVLSNLYVHTRRSRIVIQKTKHKSINTWDSVTTSHQLFLLRPYIMALCLCPPPLRERLFTLLSSECMRCTSLFTLQCIVHYVSMYITESKLSDCWQYFTACLLIGVRTILAIFITTTDYKENITEHVILNPHIHGNRFHFFILRDAVQFYCQWFPPSTYTQWLFTYLDFFSIYSEILYKSLLPWLTVKKYVCESVNIKINECIWFRYKVSIKYIGLDNIAMFFSSPCYVHVILYIIQNSLNVQNKTFS